MFFSIITVCFNSVNTIRDTFDSVLSQSCQDYEYIVIDGGSTDGTIEIIKEFEPQFEGRMHWISEQDNGIYDAMNKGIKLSKGAYLNFMNSDDTYAFEALAKTKIEIENNKYEPGVYYGITRCVNSNKEEINITRRNHKFLKYVTINHQACFVHKSIFELYGSFDLSYKICADYYFLLTLYINDVKLYPIDIIIVNYYQDGLSKLQINKTNEENELIKYKLGYSDKWNIINYRILLFMNNYVNVPVLRVIHFFYKYIK